MKFQLTTPEPVQKDTHKAGTGRKTPTGHPQKTPTRRKEKTPVYYSQRASSSPCLHPVTLSGVISALDFEVLLLKHGQDEWTSPTRRGLLLLLIDFLRRQAKRTGISCSHSLAHQFVSKHGRAKDRHTFKEPLLLLCHLGILKIQQRAVYAHVRTSHRYEFTPAYADKTLELRVELPPYARYKREHAAERNEDRLNRLYPFRKQLRADLATLRWHDDARPEIVRLKETHPKAIRNVEFVVNAVDSRNHTVRVNERGQITTSISSCKRELQPLLVLDGEPVFHADISYAHHCLLPWLLKDRIQFKRARGEDVSALEAEHAALGAFLSDGDYYRKISADPASDAERDKVKKQITTLLNLPNHICQKNELYLRVRNLFPLTFGVIEDIKGNDHRNISKQLHRKQSDVVNGALRELQQKGIRAIPMVDCLICQQSQKAVVSETLARWLFEKTGVKAKVGGLRHP